MVKEKDQGHKYYYFPNNHIKDHKDYYGLILLYFIIIIILLGAFACVFKSKRYPGEMVGTRRGSPLLLGIKSNLDLIMDSIPVRFR